MAAHDFEKKFARPTEFHSFDGALFDMDGTIIDSKDAIEKYWHKSVHPVAAGLPGHAVWQRSDS